MGEKIKIPIVIKIEYVFILSRAQTLLALLKTRFLLP